MENDDAIWRLRLRLPSRRGEDLVGAIAVDEHDFPWLHGRFLAGPAHEEVRDLFARELVLLDRMDEDGSDESAEAWETVHDQVNRTMTLTRPTGGTVAEFLLHIQDGRAWFRWSDTPVPKDEV